MPKSIINTKNIKDADVVIISAPYDKTASFHKGTAEGPKKVIECLDTQIEFFDRRYKKDLSSQAHIFHKNLTSITKMSPERAYDTVMSTCESFKDKFVFLIGGEHSMSFGALTALAQKHNPKDVTIVQIDAHCDLRHDDSDYNDSNPTMYAHSAVMRRAHEMGYNLVQVGIRAYSEDEYNYAYKNKNITMFPWGEQYKGDTFVAPSIAKILSTIKTKKVYISIDVDGFDPSIMPGTGTPVSGGLDWYYGLKLLEKVIEKKDLVGADIVEVSPMKESVLTEYNSAQIIYNMINTKFYKK